MIQIESTEPVHLRSLTMYAEAWKDVTLASSNKIACLTGGLNLKAHCTEVYGSNEKGGPRPSTLQPAACY